MTTTPAKKPAARKATANKAETPGPGAVDQNVATPEPDASADTMTYSPPVDPEATEELVYVGPSCEVTMPALGFIVAVRGVPVAVPAAVVGRAPSGEPGTDDYDPGEGLLAQVENWTLPGTDAHKDAPPPMDTPWTDEAEANTAGRPVA